MCSEDIWATEAKKFKKVQGYNVRKFLNVSFKNAWTRITKMQSLHGLHPSRHNAVDSTYILRNCGTLIICSLSVTNVATLFIHFARIFNQLLKLYQALLAWYYISCGVLPFILVRENMPPHGFELSTPWSRSARSIHSATTAVDSMC